MTQFRRAGFTLVELMIVTALLGILASIALPKFGKMIDKAREAVLKGQLGAMRSALSLYYVNNEGIYPRAWYNSPPTIDPGLFNLHPKYIDFQNMQFRPPRYASGWYSSLSALDAYDPSRNFKLAGIIPVPEWSNRSQPTWTPVFFQMNHPVYFAQHSGAPGFTCSRAIIQIGNLSLVDSSGRYWSTW